MNGKKAQKQKPKKNAKQRAVREKKASRSNNTGGVGIPRGTVASNFKAASRFMENYHNGMYDYYVGLLDPESAIARVPTYMPVPSCLAQYKQVVTVTAGSSGFIRLAVNPWAGFVNSSVNYTTLYYTGGTSTDTGIGSDGASFVMPVTSLISNCTKYRPTSCKLEVIPSGSDYVEAGFSSLTFVPNFSSVWTSTTDGVRDFDNTVYGSKHQRYSKTWRPLDETDKTLLASTQFKTDTGGLVYIGSGLASGQPITFRIVVNYEYLPAGTMTDLLNPAEAPAPASNHDEIMAAINSKEVKKLTATKAKTYFTNLISSIPSRIMNSAAKVVDNEFMGLIPQFHTFGKIPIPVG